VSSQAGDAPKFRLRVPARQETGPPVCAFHKIAGLSSIIDPEGLCPHRPVMHGSF